MHRVLFSVIVTRFPLIVSEQASEEALEGEICLGIRPKICPPRRPDKNYSDLLWKQQRKDYLP